MMNQKATLLGARLSVYAAYLAPFVVWAVTMILFSLPRFSFTYLGEEHEAMGMFTLLSNTWDTCQGAFDAKDVTPDILFFARTMTVYTVLFWVVLVWFTVLALHSLFCPLIAFSCKPTSTASNRIKQIFAFAYFNRVFYAIFQTLPFLLTLFPNILLACYDSKMGMKMTLSYRGIPDPLLIFILFAVSVALFLLTLNQQRTLHIDMFRLYKRRVEG